MKQLQLEVRVGKHLLSLPFHLYGQSTTTSWLHCLWKDIDDLPIQIKLHQPPLLPLLRVNDNYIMEIIIKHCFFTSTERLHHKRYALSHITNGHGDNLR